MLKPPRLRRSHRHIPEGFHFLLEGKPHPLLIPSIIDEIASYLSLQDLKSFRRVCRSWENESSKKIRQISKVAIQDDEGLVQFTKFYAQTPKQRQSLSYELKGDIDLGSDSVKKFFKLFGAPVEYVYFNRVRWTDGELRCILFNQLPNLHTLAVEARAYSDRRLFVDDDRVETLHKIKVLKLNVFSFITELTTPFLRDLLRACPNLEKISSIKTEKRNPLPMQFIQYICAEMSHATADDIVTMPYTADIAIAEALIDSKDVYLPKLSVLDCNMRLRGPCLVQLGQRCFPLKQLDLTILSDVSTRVIHDVLSGLENTLNILKLKFHPRCSAGSEQKSIPPLKNLTTLTLNGYRSSLKLLETLPALTHLTLIRLPFNKAISCENIQFGFVPKLDCLQVHEDFSRKCTKSTVNTVIRLFPSVKRLKLENLTDDGLQALFASYPQLEELDGMNGCYSDAGVVGYSTEAFNLWKQEDQIVRGGSSSNTVSCHDRCLPSIADLKHLRNLSLGSPMITDTSIIHGVVHCRNLRRLHLLSSSITDASLSKILDNLDLFHLKTEFCFKISKKMAEFAHKKMRARVVSINEYLGPVKQCEIPKFMRRNGTSFVRMEKLESPLQPQHLQLAQIQHEFKSNTKPTS